MLPRVAVSAESGVGGVVGGAVTAAVFVIASVAASAESGVGGIVGGAVAAAVFVIASVVVITILVSM